LIKHKEKWVKIISKQSISYRCIENNFVQQAELWNEREIERLQDLFHKNCEVAVTTKNILNIEYDKLQRMLARQVDNSSHVLTKGTLKGIHNLADMSDMFMRKLDYDIQRIYRVT
jgi:hypothetical protein